MSEGVSDPLKNLEEVCKPDPRERQMPTERLHLIHAELSQLSLTDSVPVSVRQLFETAKNASLYTYFVYRFHQVSESVAYQAMELALRLKAGYPGDPDEDQWVPGMAQLIDTALKNGWIRNEGYASRDITARARVRHRKIIELLVANPDAEIDDVPEPTAEEIAATTRPFDAVLSLKRIPIERNKLAHGSSRLFPGSRTTLRFVAETINQLFPAQRPVA